MYGYKNKSFLDFLKNKGFYIAHKSKSNYSQTALSLASSLNFNYINYLLEPVNIETNNRIPLKNKITSNLVFKTLRSYNYKIFSFESGYDLTELRNVDSYLISNKYSLNEFEYGLISTTFFKYVLDRFKIASQFDQYRYQRKRILFTMNKLPDIEKPHNPIFVFAHLLIPHPPFIFKSNGNKVNINRKFTLADGNHYMAQKGTNKKEYKKEYLEQLIYVNHLIKQLINKLLSKPRRPVIIILQGDHGPGSELNHEDIKITNLKERYSILNAYYLNKNNIDMELYEEISPVNTFRIVFNRYFPFKYKLLKDECYFSTWSHPYKFQKIKF